MFKLPAFRLSKTVKVQPTNELHLKNPEEEVENLEGHEYSLKGTCGSSRPATKDVMCAPSIERLRKEVKFLRILVGALIVVSVISFVLNIWIIHKDGKQNKPQNQGMMECLWLYDYITDTQISVYLHIFSREEIIPSYRVLSLKVFESDSSKQLNWIVSKL